MESTREVLPPPPPPPVIPPDVVPEAAKRLPKPKRVPVTKRGTGSKGQRIQLLSNHFKVGVSNANGYFFHYSVSLFYEDGRPVEAKGIGRRVIEKVYETYRSVLGRKDFAYDGEKSLFTIDALPDNDMKFTVHLDAVSSNRANCSSNPLGNESPNENDKKRLRRTTFNSKTFRVGIKYATRIPMQAITASLRCQESENSEEAVRVLNIILRQHAARQGCLLVRQSFFHDDSRNFVDLKGGVLGCRGFHSSFRAVQGGLSLNMDGSTTTVIQPGPLVDFLLANQNVPHTFQLDWTKVKRTLKNLRIRVSPSNQEYKITGLSEQLCKDQIFTLKSRGSGDGNDVGGSLDIIVADYFTNKHYIDLRYSGDLPCINVGKPKRPTYIPMELCSLLPLQRYTKALTVIQRSTLVETSRLRPQEKMRILSDVMRLNNYAVEPMLRSCGVTINNQFMRVEGRILSAPKLKVGNGNEIVPRNVRWNFNHKTYFEPAKIGKWAVVNFSARCNVRGLVNDLIRIAEMKGISLGPQHVFLKRVINLERIHLLFEWITCFDKWSQAFENLSVSSCVFLPIERTLKSMMEGPWKKKTLVEYGIVNQCLAPNRVSEQYITNVMLKINAKLAGLNSVLVIERSQNLPVVSKKPTIIFGMDVWHGSPGQSDIPSIAAVVSSRNWPRLSRYRASVRSQSAKEEMVDALFKPSGEYDNGIIRELLMDFYQCSEQRKPAHIIIFRDGVGESQFSQVLNIELDQIMEACKFLDPHWDPKFAVIIAQKIHHTKFFQAGSPDNVPPGTVVDTGVCHPTGYDFYMCAHAGMIGTTRPTHYHVLYDEIGFSTDEMQELVHSLSYVYQRSSTAISAVAPVRYAHLAASQFSTFVKFEDMSDANSGHGSTSSSGQLPVPELPKVAETVRSSMFFC